MRTDQHDTAARTLDTGTVLARDGAPILRYEPVLDGRVLHVEWQPNVPLEEVKRGFSELGRILRAGTYAAVLSSSNNYAGDWSELIPWIRYEFLPQALAGGVRFLADVLPEDPANSWSVFSWREETRDLLRHEIFHNLDAARAWLLEVLPKK